MFVCHVLVSFDGIDAKEIKLDKTMQSPIPTSKDSWYREKTTSQPRIYEGRMTLGEWARHVRFDRMFVDHDEFLITQILMEGRCQRLRCTRHYSI